MIISDPWGIGRTLEDKETEIKDLTTYDLARKCGLPDDAARFVDEWLPEYRATLTLYLAYWPYSWLTIAVMDDKELNDWLACYPITREKFEEERGSIYEDASFIGHLVIGK